ncbi:hypothetical protein ACET3Z_031464 [Daucus carota]
MIGYLIIHKANRFCMATCSVSGQLHIQHRYVLQKLPLLKMRNLITHTYLLLENDSDEWLALQGKKSTVHDDMEKSDTSEYEPTDQEESEPLHTDDELVETSDEDELISTMRDRI